MLSIDIIAPHVEREHFRTPVHDCPAGTVCAFSGRPITQGCRIKDTISGNWTDWDWLPHGGEWVSVEFALTVAETFPSATTEGFYSGLRNYSFTCTPEALRLLKRDEILDALLNPPPAPFIFVITEGGKKHASFKAPVNFDQGAFEVMTDKGGFMSDRALVDRILPHMQAMYSVMGANDKQQRTWFTKDEIRTLDPSPNKIVGFGIDRYTACYNALHQYRNSLLYQFLIFALQKS